MSIRRTSGNPMVWRILAATSCTAWGWIATRKDDKVDEWGITEDFKKQEPFLYQCTGGTFSVMKSETLPFSWMDPNRTLMEGSVKENATFEGRVNQKKSLNTTNKETKIYDFVVIGYGNAGQSAVKVLRKRCPLAKIAVVDPLRQVAVSTDRERSDNVDYYADSVTRLHPKFKTLQLLTDLNSQLQYRHGVLVATGARGAPPPLELFDENSLSRVLELRTTEIAGSTKRPVMPPDRVRTVVLEVASKGVKVGILGSGWEALDLAFAAAQVSKKKKPTLVFGSPGPAWHILPQYLSSELRKKLFKRGIEIQDRSIVRYVANVSRPGGQQIELHTARTYDILETQRSVLDLLVSKWLEMRNVLAKILFVSSMSM